MKVRQSYQQSKITMQNESPKFKIVLVGAWSSGKTTYNSHLLFNSDKKRINNFFINRLLIRYTEHKVDFKGYVPELFDATEVTVNIDDNKSARAELWDTAGEEERGNKWRPFSYPQTDIFFICYSVAAVEEIRTRKRIEFFSQEIKGINYYYFFENFV